MKVLLVNTFDRGGAANACLRLHSGLLNAGINSKVIISQPQKQTSLPEIYTLKPQTKRQTIVDKIINRVFITLRSIGIISIKTKKDFFYKNRDKRLEYFSFPDSNFDITSSPLYKEADVINLHWVADILDYKSFFKKNTKPVVWTIHDMNPFSGGEHYEEIYLGINEKGNPIKRIISKEEKKVFERNIQLKYNALKAVKDLHIVTLCSWMNNEVKKSRLFKDYPIYLIPNGVDTTIFKIKDREQSRKLFNLPLDKKVILFVADSIDNSRKGFEYLKKAFESLNSNNLVLCAIGYIRDDLKVANNIIELGSIEDENLMCSIYNAADVFVIPSLMDNLPNTVLESLLCGTPVIGFPVGGILDMVIDGENGYVSKEISVHALLETIHKFIKNQHIFNKAIIRENAIKNYDLSVQVNAYIKLFSSL